MKLLAIAFAASAIMMSPAMAQKIGVSMSYFDDVFLTTLRGVINNKAKELGVDIQFEDGQGDIGRQINQIQNFIAQGVDVIMLNPVDTASTPQMTKLVTEAGIPLVYFSRAPQDAVSGELPEGVYYIGADESTSGPNQAKEVARLLNGKGKVVIMMGELGDNAARLRTEGAENVFAEYPDIEIIQKQTANFFRTEAMDLMLNWLVSGVEMDAVVANNDEMAIGAIMALQQSNQDPKALVIAGVDGTPDALSHVRAGNLDVTVFQDSKGIGEASLDTAIKVAKGEPAETFTWVPFKLVTKENYEEFLGKN
jgi:inositol transport system substrate-binding protein